MTECFCPSAVKVVLVPEGHVMTVAFAIGLSIQELKRHLAAELRVPADVLQISVDGKLEIEHERWSLRKTLTVFPVFFNLRLIFTYVLPPQRFCFPRVCLFVDVSAGLSAEFHKTTSQIPIKPRIDHDADSDKGMDPGTFSHFL